MFLEREYLHTPTLLVLSKMVIPLSPGLSGPLYLYKGSGASGSTRG